MNSLLFSIGNYALPSGEDWEWGLICLLPLFYGAFRGWKNGFVKEVFSFIGIFIGFYVAYQLFKYSEVGWLGFIVIWIAVPLALNAVAWLLTKLMDDTVVIGTMNKLLGAAVGFLKFAFFLGCIILAIDYVRDMKHKLEENPVVEMLEKVPNVLFPEINKEVEKDGGE